MKNRRYNNHASDRGFTLIEVLLVLVILVVLGSIAASQFLGVQDKANINAAKAQVSQFATSIDMYKFDTKQYPGTLEELIQKPSDSTMAERWAGPYLDKSKVPVDPWDNEFKYSKEGKKNSDKYDVWSAGPDGQDGSDDDIGNWEK
ncbi:Type II secretion system protein G precursor [Pirellulimonas nuda]|uniref:Type II secretion system core protein G n=1 Tax=Pirellulimonas nuda TaxID=2528009 RepID=A0A518DET1_9BACT|nr:type II secretion system major pseudopilin GspG [Pirellulimonas nuda]QDU89984.1 Type II secretion system protein G precursor [Pirellulimonas nuda]